MNVFLSVPLFSYSTYFFLSQKFCIILQWPHHNISFPEDNWDITKKRQTLIKVEQDKANSICYLQYFILFHRYCTIISYYFIFCAQRYALIIIIANINLAFTVWQVLCIMYIFPIQSLSKVFKIGTIIVPILRNEEVIAQGVEMAWSEPCKELNGGSSKKICFESLNSYP